MTAIDFGSGPNTATGDTVAQALVKLQARLDALGSGTPAPIFTTAPSISPTSGAAGTTFTLTKGAASNATSLVGRVLLNGSQVAGDVATYASAAGSLVFEVTATGPGGTTVATSAAVTVTSASLTAPTGYYANGSTNPTWSAAVAAILAGGATRYRAMLVGDSTGVGQGGGTDGSAWFGAWQNRPVRWMAQRLTTAGVTANHLAFTSDQGVVTNGNSAQDSTDYNTSIITFGSWTRNGYPNLPGGSYLTAPDTTQLLTYNIPAGTNKFLLVGINAGGTAGSVEIKIDGANPNEGVSSLTTVGTNSGYSQTLVSVTGKGTHTLTLRQTTGAIAVNGLLAYDGSLGGVDFYTNARPGATTAERATTGGNFEARSFLAYIAPAVTVINLGLNDMATGVAPATITANLQLIITTAKASGDVLLMFPQPAAAPFNNNVTAVHAAVKQLAVNNGIAFFSLFEFEGGVFTASDMQDANVHPKAATYQRYHTATGVALLKMAGM